MPIKVGKLTDAYGSAHAEPAMRAAALGYAGADYLDACTFLKLHHETLGPLVNFILPTMHQTLELLTKAIAFKIDEEFPPKKYSHRILALVRDYEKSSPVFGSMIADSKTVNLLEELEKSYLGVRYGECWLSYDVETWQLFVKRAHELLNELRTKTKLRFPTRF